MAFLSALPTFPFNTSRARKGGFVSVFASDFIYKLFSACSTRALHGLTSRSHLRCPCLSSPLFVDALFVRYTETLWKAMQTIQDGVCNDVFFQCSSYIYRSRKDSNKLLLQIRYRRNLVEGFLRDTYVAGSNKRERI